jgi:uncharacterized protein DUF4230
LTEPTQEPRPRTPRNLLIILLVVVLITIAGAYMAWRITKQAVENVFTRAMTRKEETIDLGALVTQVRELNRLETAAMHVMHVSTTTQTYDMVPDAFAGDQLTFLAAGDVIAGVDMALLNKNDVWREADGSVVIRLPPSQVLVTRVDNKESHVISRKTGILRRADVNLESRARQRAEQEIRNEAVRKGILNLAAQNAEVKLAEFLHTTGVKRVKFVKSGTAAPPS